MKFESITLENQQCSNLIEKPYCVAKTDGKYVVISDLHIPYHLEKLVFQIAKTHKYQSLIVNGDLLDMETVSTYGHEKTHVLLEEIKIGNQLIRELKNYFENIYVLDGNHERRLGRYIERKAEEIALLTPYSANYYVCRNIRFLDDCIEDYGPLDGIKYVKTRFLLIGDVLFTHPDTFLRAPASLLKRVIETAISEDIQFNKVVIGHTHRISMHNYLNKVGYEIGCLTYNRKYVLKKRNLMLQMPQIGYATIEYDDDIARVVNISQFSVKELSL